MAGLYIHIPFCRRKCRYCDFVSFPDLKYEDLYFIALVEEMRLYSPLMKGRTFDTVFIGGGTPTVLKSGRAEAILNAARGFFSISSVAEITCEANPESATEEKLQELKSTGVNRLSIGLQSADDSLLRTIGRVHTYEDFLSAFHLARSSGFDNINVDVMHGLPGQSSETYLDTLEKVCELGAEHISSYALILEENTPLYEEIAEGKLSLPDPDEVADMEDVGFDILENNGYIRYEISNFAKPGCECRHNLNYWNNGEYLGIGLNSHSALHIKGDWIRFSNTDVLSEYIEKLGSGMVPVKDTETIDKKDEMFESIMLGLRKTKGVSRSEFEIRYGVDPVVHYAAAVSALELENMLVVTDDSMYLNKRGLDFQNEALLKFMDQ